MAKVIDGKAIAADIRKELEAAIKQEQVTDPNFKPGLAILQVGDFVDSSVYKREAMKAGKEIGINVTPVELPNTTGQQTIEEEIEKLNGKDDIHGIIIMLPLETSKPVNTNSVIEKLIPEKDIEGLTWKNFGQLATWTSGSIDDCIIQCTARGCYELIRQTGVTVKGSHAVVLGTEKPVGPPIANLLLRHGATVTACHADNEHWSDVTRQGDILVVSVGQADVVKGDMIKKSAVVIDTGFHTAPAESGKKWVGDVDFDSAKEVASWLSPVPGGVGPMTVAMLMKNTFEAAKKAKRGMDN